MTVIQRENHLDTSYQTYHNLSSFGELTASEIKFGIGYNLITDDDGYDDTYFTVEASKRHEGISEGEKLERTDCSSAFPLAS